MPLDAGGAQRVTFPPSFLVDHPPRTQKAPIFGLKVGEKATKEYKCPPGFAVQFPKGYGPSNSTGFLVRIRPVPNRHASQVLRGQRRRISKAERNR